MSVDFAVRHRFTVDEFHKIGEIGIFSADDRVELINGEIVEMTPIGSGHAGCVRDLDGWLQRLLGTSVVVSSRQPVSVALDGEPIPDLAVLRTRADRYRKSHPTSSDALLIIEVSDSTVLFDRTVKSRMYARAEVPEHWVVDLPRGRVAVFTSPRRGEYAELREYGRGEGFGSNALGGREIPASVVLDGPGES